MMLRTVKPYVFLTLGIVLFAAACVAAAEPNTPSTKPDPFKMNKLLGRGVNLGNALEAPTEGAWGVVIKEEYFDIIKQAGFNSVRLPVNWSGHALNEKPYTINPEFFKRVDTIVNWAVSRNMPIIVNIQQYNETYDEPLAQKERFLALWRQIAEHYKDYPDILLFEPMNEPKRKLTPRIWNDYIKDFLAVIRQSNPNRTVVIGSARDSWITYLKLLELPENDRNIIVSVHHYFPHAFTHQSAPWMNPEKVAMTLADMKFIGQDPNSNGINDYNAWPGTKWFGTPQEKKYMTDIFDIGAAWGKEHNRPINLGEFGSYYKADMDSRVRWTKFIADTAAERGMSLMYWEFCAQEFGLYDRDAKSWRKSLLDAVIPPEPNTTPAQIDPFKMNQLLGRGVNFGNAFDAPTEGAWGVVLQEGYFQTAKDAGFDSIRLPVRWSAHALAEAPYTINPEFMKRIDWAVNCAISRKLPIMLNVHHYGELYADPVREKERYLALWKQIAEYFKDYPDILVFEILNEPQKELTAEPWNERMKDALAVVRQSNPNRTIVIGSAHYNQIHYLTLLDIPKDEHNVIVTVHDYFPLRFTHQGAAWLNRGEPNDWLGTKWTGTEDEKQEIIRDLDFAAAWGKKNNRPINLGEFGAYDKADMDSRARWTKFMADAAIERGMSFDYWEFCAPEFGLYDQKTRTFRKPLLEAVLPSAEGKVEQPK